MATEKKLLDFYYRAKKQYESAPKPFIYELNPQSTQPKPRKLMIIISKFIDVVKDNMLSEIVNEDQIENNYWQSIFFLVKDSYEMNFIVQNVYDKKKNKLRLYFGLLMHTKRIFQVIEHIITQGKNLYIDPKLKIDSYKNQLQPLNFLKDGQYNIMGDTISSYQIYIQQVRQREQLEQIKKQKKEQERKKKQQQEKIKKIEQAQNKQKQQQRLMQQKLKKKQIQQQLERERLKKNIEKEEQFINLQFIPQKYKGSKFTQENYQNNWNVSEIHQQQLYKPRKKHQKNSQILYNQKYKDQHQVFSFKSKPQENLEQQNCQECGKHLSNGLYILGNNKHYCYYTGKWYCNEDIADERMPIPYKAIQNFDLRGYSVCRKAYAELKSCYEKPIIQLKNDEHVVCQNQIFYEFLVLRKQIHLMYDSICNLQLIQPLLRKRLNYCLKKNLFSLKNLYDIYNGHEGPSLQRQYDILSKHFYRCEVCQKKKGYICSKCQDPVRIFPFEIKETKGCKTCRKLYHRKCLNSNQCQCKNDD